MINSINIENQILSLMKSNPGGDSEESMKYFAKGMSQIISDAIKSATITVPIIPVQTVPATGTGTTVNPTTATIK